MKKRITKFMNGGKATTFEMTKQEDSFTRVSVYVGQLPTIKSRIGLSIPFDLNTKQANQLATAIRNAVKIAQKHNKTIKN